ncbi:hypothetical protein OEZ86_014322 [Tetradesmus obliquus]|nr:hypothetical protein OEZ86_014322 [Tetradesmus obliquus]
MLLTTARCYCKCCFGTSRCTATRHHIGRLRSISIGWMSLQRPLPPAHEQDSLQPAIAAGRTSTAVQRCRVIPAAASSGGCCSGESARRSSHRIAADLHSTASDCCS